MDEFNEEIKEDSEKNNDEVPEENEVNELYRDNFKVEKLAAKSILEDEPRFKERGLTSLMETAYKLTKNT